MISGFVETAEFLVIPQIGELLLDGVAPGQLRQITKGEFVLLLDKLFGGRRVGILQPAIGIGDLDAVIIVHLIALGSDRVIELSNDSGAKQQRSAHEQKQDCFHKGLSALLSQTRRSSQGAYRLSQIC